ncbi:hypothetical protein HMSSN139_05290 [Paenibacillus sp. HMSSN-139]|nr:hypothetical protein HMSSN139_05290 [Paenibacillus sp. HMSSN-139]
MSFPYRLKQLRKEHKWTQEELGAKLNLTKVSISGYENGNRTPDMDTLIKISNVFNVSIDYLVGKSDVRSVDSPIISGQVLKNSITNSPKPPLLEQIFFRWFFRGFKRRKRKKLFATGMKKSKRKKKVPPTEKDTDESAWDLKDK